MHIKKSFNMLKREAGMPASLKSLINELTSCSEDELVEKLDHQVVQGWDRPRGDLCLWIPVLDRIDTILEQNVEKYGLDQDYPQPRPLDAKDEKLLISVLNFSALLLFQCSNRSIYSSVKSLAALLNCLSPSVVASALNVCNQIAARFMHSKAGRVALSYINIEKIIQLATFLPISQYEKVDKSDITLWDFIDPNHVWPEEAATFSMQYYVRSAQSGASQPAGTNTASPVTPTRPKKDYFEAPSGEGLTPFKLTAKEVHESKPEQLLAKIYEVVPKEYWFTALNKVRVAKACTNTERGLVLRQELAKIQTLAWGFAFCKYSEQIIEQRFTIKCPTIVRQICELVHPDHAADIPLDLYIAIFQTLEFGTDHNDWLSEVISGLSANVTHGILMSVMRNLYQSLKSGAELNETYSIALLRLVVAVSAAATQIGVNLTPGLLPLITEMIQVDSARIKTLAHLAELLDQLFENTVQFNAFQEDKGPEKMIFTAKKVIDASLDPNLNESPPSLCIVDYSVSYYRTQFIRALLGLVSNILQHTRAAERISCLSDTPLLELSKTIVTNASKFGNRVIHVDLQILCNMLENEQSAFAIMQEAKIIDIIVDAIPSLLKTSPYYFHSVAKFLSAISHNEQGVAILKESNLLENYFEELGKTMVEQENLKHLGSTFDVMTGDHPDLRNTVVSSVLKLLKWLATEIQSEDGRFYREAEAVGEEPLARGDIMNVVSNAVGFLDGFLKNHLTRVEFIKLKGVGTLLGLFDLKNLPFDFAQSYPAFLLGTTLRSLFDLDIDSDYIQQEVLGHLNQSLVEVENQIEPLSGIDQIVQCNDNSLDAALRAIGKLNTSLFAVFQMVFVSPGTGYRIMYILDKIASTENIENNVFSRLVRVQQWCVWHDARALEGLSKEFLAASKPVPVDPMPRQYASLYDKEEFKRRKEAEGKLEEKVSDQFFNNVKAFRFLAHALSVYVTQACHEFGSVCTSDRAMNSRKKRGLKVAEMIASAMVSHLDYDPVKDIDKDEYRNAKYQTIVNVVTIIERSIFKTSYNSSLSANIGVFVMFKQKQGIEKLGKLLHSLWTLPIEQGADDIASSLLVGAQKVILSLFQQALVHRGLLDVPRTAHAFAPRDSDWSRRDYFSLQQFYIETKIMVLLQVRGLWNSDEMDTKHHSVTSLFADVMAKLMSTGGEDNNSTRDRSELPRELSWRVATPSEDKIEVLMERGMEREEAANQLLVFGDDISRVVESWMTGTDADRVLPVNSDFNPPLGYAPVIDGQKMVTVQDLNNARDEVKTSLVDRALSLVQSHPENVATIAGMISRSVMSVSAGRSDRHREAVTSAQRDVIRTLVEATASLDGSDVSHTKSIAAVTHLLGMLLSDATTGPASLVVVEALEIFVGLLEIEGAHKKEWYPYVLLVLERVLPCLTLPKPAEGGQEIRVTSTQPLEVPEFDANALDRIFGAISILSDIENETVIVEVARLMVFFSRDMDRAATIMQNGTFASLLKAVEKFAGSKMFDKLRTAVILVARNIVETEEQLRQYMRAELNHYFKGNRQTETTGFLKTYAYLIARSPRVFVEAASELLAITDASSSNPTQICSRESLKAQIDKIKEDLDSRKTDLEHLKNEDSKEDSNDQRKDKEEDFKNDNQKDGSKEEEPQDDAKMKEDKQHGQLQVPVVESPSGVVQLLLTELFNLRRDEIFTRPEKNEEALHDEASKKEQKEFKPGEHGKFMHCCVILEMLAELVGSYNKCKLEFLNFSKKQLNASTVGTPLAKPRSFALTYFLHELLPTGTLSESMNLALQEWSTVSSLASTVLVSLLTATQERGKSRDGKQSDETQNDPTLVFVRKFSLDSFAKVLRDVHSTGEPIDYRYSILANLSELCYRLLNSRSGGIGITSVSDKSDCSAVAKIMYEKKFAGIFTTNLAEMDLNYPNAKRVAKVSVKFLNKLSQVSLQISEELNHDLEDADDEEFPTDNSSDEDRDEDDEFRDGTPDLFRNSTLGMFEVQENYDDEDEMAEGEEAYDGMEEDEEEEDEYDDHDEVLSDIDDDEDADDEMNDQSLAYDQEDEEEQDSDESDGDDMDIEVVVEGDEDDEMDPDNDGNDGHEEDSEWESYEEEEGEDEEEGPEPSEADREPIAVPTAIREDGEGEGDDSEQEGQDNMDVLTMLGGGPRGNGDMEGSNRLFGRRVDEMLEDDDFMWMNTGDRNMEPAEMVFTSDGNDDEESEPDGEDNYYDFPTGIMMPPRWEQASGNGTSEAVANPLLNNNRRGGNGGNGADRSLSQNLFFRGTPSSRDGVRAITTMVGGGGGDDNNQRSNHVFISDMFNNFAPMGDEQGNPFEIVDPFGGYENGGGLLGRMPWNNRPRQNGVLLGLQRFHPMPTIQRWQEQTMMFDAFASEYGIRIVNDLVNSIVEVSKDLHKDLKALRDQISALQEESRAIQAERARKKREEEARKQREKEAEEEKRRKEKEEEERAAAEAAAAEQAAAKAEAGESQDNDGDTEMGDQAVASTSEPQERAYVELDGANIDITGTGIDPTFLEALPADMREEVFTQHLRELQIQQRTSGATAEAPREIDPAFLEALPERIREELLDEAQLNRQVARGGNNNAGGNAPQELQDLAAGTQGVDMDLASFLATLDPQLREQLLLEQDDLALATFPPDIAAEARGLRNRTVAQFPDGENTEREDEEGEPARPTANDPLGGLHDMFRSLARGHPPGGLLDRTFRRGGAVEDRDNARQKRVMAAAALHLVDRSGVASLVRLLYLPQHQSQLMILKELLLSLCSNKQTRGDILNLLLHVLQDGSGDRHSLEKGFVQTSNRARQSLTNTPSKNNNAVSTPKSAGGNQPPKLSRHNVVLSHDISPSNVMQQTLECTESLVRGSNSVKYFFVTEHDLPMGFKKSKSKGKGKEKEREMPKEWKYPCNILMNLLDRTAVKENTGSLERVTQLLYEVTRGLGSILKDGEAKDKKQSDGDQEMETTQNNEAAPISQTSQTSSTAATGETETTGQEAGTTNQAEEDEEEESEQPRSSKKKRSHRLIEPPYIPEYNLRRVSGILTAKECTSRTFQHSLGVMQNLSALPNVKDYFGNELLKQAMELNPVITQDLKDLVERVEGANKAADLQGTALLKFSSSSSDQAKLLRVLTAIDYLFDTSRNKKNKKNGEEDASAYLKSLYKSMTFGPLWSSLSNCLQLVQDRQDMMHVATALLPLIESLMVVCKHSSVKDVQIRGDKYEQRKNDFESEPLESLFFTFTDEHRKILNQIIRNSPKLMSGSFSILVKNPRALEFDNKRRYFYRKICPNNNHATHSISLNVRRDQVFLDSYRALYFKGADEIKKSRLSVRFQGEEGVDAGGVTREWFQVLSRQMFNADYALFTPVASDKTTFHPNRTSWVNPEHLTFFKFIGRIIGKAIYDGRVLDCHFSRAVYKKILGKTVSIKDMESLDLEYYKSLVWMLENPINDIITETFSLETEDYGEQKIIDLKPGGRDIPVTDDNKREFVNLVVEYRLLTSIKEQMDSFLQGFHDIIPKEVVAIFDEQELELLISGLPDIDLDDWRNNTDYHNYSASSSQIKWFWRAVRSFDNEEKAKLLQFVTGTSKVPLNGFGQLEGMNGIQKFNIHRDYGSKDRLPSSHTCFNQLDLPEYDSYDTLRGSLLMAISEGKEGFGFA